MQRVAVLYSKIYKSFYKYKTTYLIILSFLIPFSFFLFSCKSWYLCFEDFPALLYASKVKCFRDFWNMFIHGDVMHCPRSFIGGSNDFSPIRGYSFFEVFYRPFLLFVLYLQYKVLGLNAHYYYIFIIFFHSVITSLFFYILSLFVNYKIAFFISLAFAFNSTLFSWLGDIQCQQHQICTFLFLVMILFLYKFLIHKDKNYRYMFFSSIAFFFALLTRETPAIVFLMIFIFLLVFKLSSQIRNKVLMIICSLGLVFLLYVFLRQIGYPIYFLDFKKNTLGNSLLIDFLCILKNSLFNFFEFVFSLLVNIYHLYLKIFIYHGFYFYLENINLIWIYKVIKDLLFFLLFLLFITNKKKREIIFFSICSILFYWPALLYKAGGVRYAYKPSLFLLLSIAFLVNFSSIKNLYFKRLIIICFIFFISIQAFFLSKDINFRSMAGKNLYDGIQLLNNNNKNYLNCDSMIFFDLPGITKERVVSSIGTLEAFQLYGNNKKASKIMLDQFKFFPKLIEVEKFLKIEQNKDKIHFISIKREKLWFNFENYKSCYFIKNVIINDQDEDGKIYDLIIEFKEDYIGAKLQLVTWDYNKNNFLVLNSYKS